MYNHVYTARIEERSDINICSIALICDISRPLVLFFPQIVITKMYSLIHEENLLSVSFLWRGVVYLYDIDVTPSGGG